MLESASREGIWCIHIHGTYMHSAYMHGAYMHTLQPPPQGGSLGVVCVLSRGLEVLGPVVAMCVLKSEPPFPPRVPYEDELNAAWVAYQVASDGIRVERSVGYARVPYAAWVAFQVASVGIRPPMPDDAPPFVEQLITTCWAQKVHLRPSFGAICDTLAYHLADAGQAVVAEGHPTEEAETAAVTVTDRQWRWSSPTRPRSDTSGLPGQSPHCCFA